MRASRWPRGGRAAVGRGGLQAAALAWPAVHESLCLHPPAPLARMPAAPAQTAPAHLDVPLAQRVVDHVLVLLHHHGAGGVDLVEREGWWVVGGERQGGWAGGPAANGRLAAQQVGSWKQARPAAAAVRREARGARGGRRQAAARPLPAHAPRIRRWATPRPPGRWPPAAAASAGARTSRSPPGSWRTARGGGGASGGKRGRAVASETRSEQARRTPSRRRPCPACRAAPPAGCPRCPHATDSQRSPALVGTGPSSERCPTRLPASQPTLTEGSLEMTPVPEQGASSSTRSTLRSPSTRGSSRPS